MSTKDAVLSVYRFNPARDKEPRFQDYTVKAQKGVTILDALRKIKDEVDGSLSLRFSCRSAICGSCAMKINGFSRLACKTQILDELKDHEKIVLEPMGNLPMLKDLIVDMEPFWTRMNSLKPWLIRDPTKKEPEKEYLMSKEEVQVFEGTPNCIVCGACHSVCPAYEADPSFPGPAALAKAHRFAVDDRDDARKERLEAYSKIETWLCVRCHLCVEACPKDVKPGEMITKLKELTVKEGYKDNIGAKHAIAFAKNIEKYGDLNEERLVIDTVGIGGLPKRIPQGIRLVLKGKYRALPIQKPIPGIEDVKKIYKEFEGAES